MSQSEIYTKAKTNAQQLKIVTRQEAMDLGLKTYFTGKPCIRGHVSEWLVTGRYCIPCKRELDKKYRIENKEANAKIGKIRRDKNKESILLQHKKYRINNPMQSKMRHKLRRLTISKSTEKINEAEIELGYTKQEFLDHMISKFTDGMSWDNHGEWHIDHIVPISVFLKQGIVDPKIIHNLTNLQPLWAMDNLTKQSNVY